MKNKLLAEFFGTLWLVFGGCGSAVLAAKFIATEGATPINLGIGLVGVALAFGLTVLTMAYAIGHISGCHLNPAVTLARAFTNTFAGIRPADVPAFVIAQLLGAALATLLFRWLVPGEPAIADNVRPKTEDSP